MTAQQPTGTPDADSGLGAEQRATLAALAGALIPAAGDMPSAPDVDVHGRWIDRSLRARPELSGRLVEILDASAGDEPAAVVERLRATDTDTLEFLLDLVTTAYYMSPKVRKRLGYPGQRADLPLPDEADHYLRDEILAPVVQRGPIYRDPAAGTT